MFGEDAMTATKLFLSHGLQVAAHHCLHLHLHHIALPGHHTRSHVHAIATRMPQHPVWNVLECSPPFAL